MPEVWPFEIANSIFVAFAKRKRITEEQIQEFRQDLWTNAALESLSRKHNLAAYDAAYLDLAMRHAVPLATSDEGLKKAALSSGVHLV